MHEATQISYGLGTVNITLNSESRTEIDAPDFRFADYDQVLCSCFTQKELEQIAEGDHAELIFNLVMNDSSGGENAVNPLSGFARLQDKIIRNFNEGVYLSFDASKSLGNKEESQLEMFYEKVDLQFDIPEYLLSEGREFFLYSDYMGSAELFEDTDKEAETLSVNTNFIGTSMLGYRDFSFISNAKTSYPQGHQSQYLCVIGIIALLLLWKRIDFLHKKE